MIGRMLTRLFAPSVAMLLCVLCSDIARAEEPWEPLFDGKTLQGWVQRGGEARYEVEDGAIVGVTALNTSNTFLCTERTFSDFILELDFRLDAEVNSGVQIRSNSYPEYHGGCVHGYQVEIDPSERAWTGGLYEESGRGWLYPIEDEETKKAFQLGRWNHFRIEALGDTLKTWVNGIPASHLEDDRTREGFIALQVHTVGGDEKNEGLKIRWRNLRILTRDLEKYALPTPLAPKDLYNKLTTNEESGGWKLLFDGKTGDGWRGAGKEGFPAQGWEIRDGMLTVLPPGSADAPRGKDLITVEEYGDFELCVDFLLTPGANSGIKYFVDPARVAKEGSAVGLEYQILDDERNPDAKLGNHKGSRTLASLYDLIPAAGKPPGPIGRWNHAEILSRGNHVEHWLNGRKVLEYERGTEAFERLVAESKYKGISGFGRVDKGFILLQDHGDRVSFRSIKIREY